MLLAICVALAASAACRGEPAPDVPPEYGLDLSTAETVEVGELPVAARVTDLQRMYGGRGAARGPGMLSLYRVSDLLARRGGGVYVANSGNDEILALDDGGTLRWRAGGEGEGPGEFESLAGLQGWPGDTLVALDAADNTASFWTAAGEYVRGEEAGPVQPERVPDLLLSVPGGIIGALPDGRLVILGPERVWGGGGPGLRRTRTAFTIVGEGGSRRRPFALPGPWVYELENPGRLPAVHAPMSAGTPVAVAGHATAHDLVWARPDSFEIVFLTADGRPRRLLRIERAREPVTPSVRSRYLEDWSPWFPVEEEIPFPARMPAFDEVFVTAGGDVWARFHHWGDAGEEWVRFRGASEAVDRFRFPPRVEVMAATSSAAYGVQRDELDVEHVVRLRLPPGG